MHKTIKIKIKIFAQTIANSVALCYNNKRRRLNNRHKKYRFAIVAQLDRLTVEQSQIHR